MSKARGLAALGNAYSDGALSNRSMIINGAMQVAQRGTQTGLTSSAYTLDRWQLIASGAGTFTVSQENDGPSGFPQSTKIDCTTADSSNTAGELLYFRQMLEGRDCQRLAFGTPDAQSFTVSFWVKSNQAATYVLTIQQGASGSLSGKTFSINSADTWEYKSVTFIGDTANAIANDSNIGLQVQCWLQAGSSYTTGALNQGWDAAALGDYAAGITATIGDSASDYWQITGVQLEVGDTATPFEHRSYGDELARCQRYTYIIAGLGQYGVGSIWSASSAYISIDLPVSMRATPTLESQSGTDFYRIYSGSQTFNIDDIVGHQDAGTGLSHFTFYATSHSMTTGRGAWLQGTSSSSRLIFDAEL